jgi:hypothetical protein
MAMRFLERHDNGELGSPPSCRMAAFKARADRPALPGLLEDELFRVPFE